MSRVWAHGYQTWLSEQLATAAGQLGDLCRVAIPPEPVTFQSRSQDAGDCTEDRSFRPTPAHEPLGVGTPCAAPPEIVTAAPSTLLGGYEGQRGRRSESPSLLPPIVSHLDEKEARNRLLTSTFTHRLSPEQTNQLIKRLQHTWRQQQAALKQLPAVYCRIKNAMVKVSEAPCVIHKLLTAQANKPQCELPLMRVHLPIRLDQQVRKGTGYNDPHTYAEQQQQQQQSLQHQHQQFCPLGSTLPSDVHHLAVATDSTVIMAEAALVCLAAWPAASVWHHQCWALPVHVARVSTHVAQPLPTTHATQQQPCSILHIDGPLLNSSTMVCETWRELCLENILSCCDIQHDKGQTTKSSQPAVIGSQNGHLTQGNVIGEPHALNPYNGEASVQTSAASSSAHAICQLGATKVLVLLQQHQYEVQLPLRFNARGHRRVCLDIWPPLQQPLMTDQPLPSMPATALLSYWARLLTRPSGTKLLIAQVDSKGEEVGALVSLDSATLERMLREQQVSTATPLQRLQSVLASLASQRPGLYLLCPSSTTPGELELWMAMEEGAKGVMSEQLLDLRAAFL